jgi:chemotaxis protein methyltransferase CheR
VRNVGAQRVARWFLRQPDGSYTVGPVPRSIITFQQHDLLRDPYPDGPFDLVACRNVVIYFTEAAKDRIYAGFVHALRPGGVLFVGGTEAILKPQALSLEVLGPGFYRKVAAL